MPTPVINSNPINTRVGTIIDPTGELALYGVQGTNLASNNFLNLATIDGFYVNITGTTPILNLGVASSGVLRLLTFTGSLLLTHNSVSLILPTGNSIVTQPGDAAIAISLGAGNWKVLGYFPISGKATSATAEDIGLGNVENVAVSTWEGSTSIITVGTITTGLWHGTPVSPIYGGTGLSSWTEGDTLYASSSNTLSSLPKDVTASRVLANTGPGNVPKWDRVNLTNAVTGVLQPVNGGSGLGAQTVSNPTGTTLTIDFSTGNVARVNLSSASGNITLTIQNPITGQICSIEVTQGAAARTITFPAGTRQALQGGNTWTSTGPSKVDIINIYFNGNNFVIVGTVPDIS